jgi:hypothetical protein
MVGLVPCRIFSAEVELIKRILLVDFDGVLHSYVSGWKGARVVSDPPVKGAIGWLRSLLEYPEEWGMRLPSDPVGTFKVCIYSSRSRQWGGRKAMKRWLLAHGLEKEYLRQISFPIMRPAAFLTIDDRCVCFDGTFPRAEDLLAFRPWNKREV